MWDCREVFTVLLDDLEILTLLEEEMWFVVVVFTLMFLFTCSTFGFAIGVSMVRLTLFLITCSTVDVGGSGGLGMQISDRVLNFSPRSSRKCRSLSASTRLQQPTDPAGEPWPS